MTHGYGFTGFLKTLPSTFKKWFSKKEIAPQSLVEDPEALRLKKSIRRQTLTHALRMLLTYIFLTLVALFIFIPFYWMILTSLRTYYDSSVAFNPSFWISPSNMQWINYKIVWEELDFGLYIKNTLFVGVMSTIGTVFTTVTAAYAFARLEFKGREAIFSVLIMTMMIPGELYIITNFMTVSGRGLGWVGMPAGENEYFLAMIIPFMTSISYIFFLRQNFKQIPDSLYKAALVDGCSDLKYLTRVMIPIASPTIFTITILNVIGSWNAFIWPRLITSIGGAEGQNYWLISVALRDLSFTLPGEGRIMYNLQIAASALVTVPLLIVFLSLRKYIMSGIGRSGTKG
jgi:ABC-type glycerol-3-phosphate transport system permease component